MCGAVLQVEAASSCASGCSCRPWKKGLWHLTRPVVVSNKVALVRYRIKIHFEYLYFWSRLFSKFTMFQRLYFLLHYVSWNVPLLLIMYSGTRERCLIYKQAFFFVYEPVQLVCKLLQRFRRKLKWSDSSCSRVDNSLIQMIDLEWCLQWTQIHKRELWDIGGAYATDAAR